MIVVLDVSGAVEILLHRGKADKFDKILQEASEVITPDLYVSELTNTLWKYYTHKMLNLEDCLTHVQNGIDYISTFTDSKTIWQEAFSEGIKNNHSIYDMFYMVTARRNNAILVTNDSDLTTICKNNKIEVCC